MPPVPKAINANAPAVDQNSVPFVLGSAFGTADAAITQFPMQYTVDR